MLEAFMNLLPYLFAAGAGAFWLYCLATEDPEKTVCQPEDCDTCPFPCEGCTGRTKSLSERGN